MGNWNLNIGANMGLKVKLKKMEQTHMKQLLLELLAMVIALAAVVFGTAYSTVVTVASGGRWWLSPLLLVAGFVTGSAARYAFRTWKSKLTIE
jgi:fatty acid desaturase